MAGRRLVVPRGARSNVWHYFGFEVDEIGRISKRYVVCRMCDSKLLFSGNTTNLLSHMGRCQKSMLRDNYYQGTCQAFTESPTNVSEDLQGGSVDFLEERTSMNDQNAFSEQEVCIPATSDKPVTILDTSEGKQEYCLKWKHHQANQQSMFFQLLEAERFCDVSIVCEEKFLKAHKLVLSACSVYFENVLSRFEDRNPVVILRDVKHSDMAALIQFMYKGEINIEEGQLSSLLDTANFLKVKGLSDAYTEEQKLFSTEQDAAADTETCVKQDPEPSQSGQQSKRTMSDAEEHKPVKIQRSDSQPGEMPERPRHYVDGVVQMNNYLKANGRLEQYWKEPWVAQAMKDVSKKYMTIKDCSQLLGVPYSIMYARYRQMMSIETNCTNSTWTKC